MAEGNVCDCWDHIVGLTTISEKLTRDVGDRKWKELREVDIPKAKEFAGALEKCSGIKLEGFRSRIYEIEERYAPRYDWASALGTAAGLTSEIVYDIGCRKRRKE